MFNCTDKPVLEQIMTPKARADIHMNLPALEKLDSMLIVRCLFHFHQSQYCWLFIAFEILIPFL